LLPLTAPLGIVIFPLTGQNEDSIRVDLPGGTSYRFTEWFKWVGASLRPNITAVKATELYNHSAPALGNSSEFDLHENVNLAATADPVLVETLRARLRKEFELI